MKPNMKFLVIALAALFVSSANAQEWSAPIQKKKLGVHTKAGVNIPIHKALDVAACKTNVNGEACLVVRLRNAHHKMGPSSIRVEMLDTPAAVRVGRIDISKPMSLIAEKEDGAHLFETFKNQNQTYQIFYHKKNGKLVPNVTVSALEQADNEEADPEPNPAPVESEVAEQWTFAGSNLQGAGGKRKKGNAAAAPVKIKKTKPALMFKPSLAGGNLAILLSDGKQKFGKPVILIKNGENTYLRPRLELVVNSRDVQSVEEGSPLLLTSFSHLGDKFEVHLVHNENSDMPDTVVQRISVEESPEEN